MLKLIRYISLLLITNLFSQEVGVQHPDSLSKTIFAGKAGVSSAHILASEAGVRILKQGGNAADAATAVAMALAVVYPEAGNLGGGGFLVYRSPDDHVYVLDFREIAPALASHDMYLDSSGQVEPEKSRVGALAVGIPGTVRGFYQFHKKFGKLTWYDVLQPAVRLAADGFVVNKFLHNRIREDRKHFEQFPTSEKIFLPGGDVPGIGSVFVQHDLARSLEALALHGDRPFYEGEIAREIVKTSRQYDGILTLEDLRNYQPVERDPLIINYRDYSIFTVPPPSSGGVVIAGILGALSQPQAPLYPLHSARQIGLLAQLEENYFALRNRFLGDPSFADIPLTELLSPGLSRKILEGIDVSRPVPAAEINPDLLLAQESTETTHFSVLDSAENAVSVTYTLNGSFGSYLVAGNTGILLNNEMDDFAAKPGTPNMYGLVQGEVNAVAPGKRMLSSMTPLIVTQNGHLEGALGSPGGPTIITTVLQVLINKIDYKMSLSSAVESGRFHEQWVPDSIYYEENKFNAAVLKKLEQWGYRLVKRGAIGDVQAFWRTGDGWQFCSDPRGNGFPAGY